MEVPPQDELALNKKLLNSQFYIILTVLSKLNTVFARKILYTKRSNDGYEEFHYYKISALKHNFHLIHLFLKKKKRNEMN